MTDYKFKPDESYRFYLNNPGALGDISFNPDSGVTVITNATPSSVWIAKIDLNNNVSLLKEGEPVYLSDDVPYLDAKASDPTPNTFVKFKGNPDDGYEFTITAGDKPVEHVNVDGVVRLRTVDATGDKFIITEIPSKQ